MRFSSKEPLQFGLRVPSGILSPGTSVKSSPISSMAPCPFFLSKGLSKPYADLRVPFSGVQRVCHVLDIAKDPPAPGIRDEPRASRPGDVGTRHWTSPTAKLSGCPGDGEIRLYGDPSGAIQRHPDRPERCFRTLDTEAGKLCRIRLPASRMMTGAEGIVDQPPQSRMR